MNRVFYIFRHGETNWNRERRCQGHTNTCLNERGEQQALELAQKLLNLPIEVIVSSDLERAKTTGTIVSKEKNIPLILDSRLREMNYGEAEGMLYEDAKSRYGAELWQKLLSFNSNNKHVGFPGGETREMTRIRFQLALTELIDQTTYKTIGLSTHGGILRTILHSFLPEDHELLLIPNCVVYKFEYHYNQKIFKVDPLPLIIPN